MILLKFHVHQIFLLSVAPVKVRGHQTSIDILQPTDVSVRTYVRANGIKKHEEMLVDEKK